MQVLLNPDRWFRSLIAKQAKLQDQIDHLALLWDLDCETNQAMDAFTVPSGRNFSESTFVVVKLVVLHYVDFY